MDAWEKWMIIGFTPYQTADPPKMDVLTKTFLQIIIYVKWLSRSPKTSVTTFSFSSVWFFFSVPLAPAHCWVWALLCVQISLSVLLCIQISLTCVFMRKNISHCVVVRTNISHRVVMRTNISHCVVMHTHISYCVVMRTNISHCVVMRTNISHCVVMRTNIFHCVIFASKQKHTLPYKVYSTGTYKHL